MGATIVKVSKSDRAVKHVVTSCFPQYEGRKVKIVMTDDAPRATQSDWDGGSRSLVKSFRLATSGVVTAYTPGELTVTERGWVLVDLSEFCGQDAGVTIRVHKIVDDATFGVLVDAYLDSERDPWDQDALLAELTPGEEWGSYDRGHERVTLRDLLAAAVYAEANERRKAERRAARRLERSEAKSANL